MSAPAPVPVNFSVGSRHLLSVPRELLTVSFGLADLLDGIALYLPELPAGCDGYRLLSVPSEKVDALAAGHPDCIVGGLQAYRRHYIDMQGTFDQYLGRFSAKTRSTLRRKCRKFAKETGGALDVREYRSPAELQEFLNHAVPLSERTYQARLLDVGLKSDAAARKEMWALAEQDSVRAFLLFADEVPVAYLYMPIRDDIAIYAHLGHDDAWSKLSPGTVLKMQALERLFAEQRCRYFDFTEGEGAHKAMFGTHHIDCCSLLLLRRDLSNRLLIGSLAAFDGSVAVAKSVVEKTGVLSTARKMLRS